MPNDTKPMTLAAVRRIVSAAPKKNRAAMVCALVGHSRIVTGCFGYVYCARCDAKIADKLGGAGYANAPECVQVGHNCPTCRGNYKKLGWADKYLAPNPFKKEAGRGK